MEREPKQITRREFLKIAIVGSSLALAGPELLKLLKKLDLDSERQKAIDKNFIPPAEPTKTPFQPPTKTEEPGQKKETPQPTHEPRPIVDRFIIAEKIDLSSTEPMKWLLVTNDKKAVLTPPARPYAYTVENQEGNIFDWKNHTTLTYLEENGIPVVWGHSGLDELFFHRWAELLRKPEGYVLKRLEAQREMIKNIIGSSVFMLQSSDESLLPKSPSDLNSVDPNVKIVEVKVIAGVFIPRWQNVSEVDESGNLTANSRVKFDGGGHRVDFVTRGYNRHTMDFIRWIKDIYPDDPQDAGQTQKLFRQLPKPNIIVAKFCISAFSDDPPAPKKDSDGNPIIPASYGRFIMVFEVNKA